MVPGEVVVGGQQSYGSHPNTFVLLQPRRCHLWLSFLLLGQTGVDGGRKFMAVSQGLPAQGQHQHGQFWSGGRKELIAHSSGEGAGRGVGGASNRAQH